MPEKKVRDIPALWLKSSVRSEKLKLRGIWLKKPNEESISKIESARGCPVNSELLNEPPEASPMDGHGSKKLGSPKPKPTSEPKLVSVLTTGPAPFTPPLNWPVDAVKFWGGFMEPGLGFRHWTCLSVWMSWDDVPFMSAPVEEPEPPLHIMLLAIIPAVAHGRSQLCWFTEKKKKKSETISHIFKM